MRILVTGGAGFIGSWVVDALIADGHDVMAVDNLSTGRTTNIDPRAEFTECDLRDGDIDAVVASFRPELVNHHAAHASVPGSVSNPLHDAMVNVIGSVRLLDACARHGVKKVVYAASGGSTYGAPEYVPVDENHRIDPISPYAVSKHTVEHYLRTFNYLHGIRYTSLRYANIYGPRQDPHGEAGVIAIFSDKMIRGETPLIHGSGTDERDYVFVADVARANALAVSRGDNTMVNIGTGVGTNVLQLFAALKSALEFAGDAVHGPPRAGDVPSMRLDPTLADSVLGWRPTIAIKEGVRLTVEHFLARARH